MQTRGITIEQPEDALGIEPGRHALDLELLGLLKREGVACVGRFLRGAPGANVDLSAWVNAMDQVAAQVASHLLRIAPSFGGSAGRTALEQRREVMVRVHAVFARAAVALRWPDGPWASPEDVATTLGLGQRGSEIEEALDLLVLRSFGPAHVHPAEVDVPRYARESVGGVMAYVGRVPGRRLDLDVLRGAMGRYRRGAQRHVPWLLDRGAPFVLEPYAAGPEGYYAPYDATVRLHAVELRSVTHAAHIAAHEQGHGVWREVLSDADRAAWAEATHGRTEPLDVERLLKAWRETSRYAELGYVAPDIARTVRQGVFGAQIMALARQPDFRGLTLAAFAERAQSGEPIRVPVKPVSNYGTVSPEEAFCEALGNLVGEGPATLDDEHLDLLTRTVPTARVSNPGASRGTMVRLWIDRCEGEDTVSVVAWGHPSRRQRRDVVASIEARCGEVTDPHLLPRIGKTPDSPTYLIRDVGVAQTYQGRGLGAWLYTEAARLAALHDGSIAAERREVLGTTSALALRTWSSARLGSQLILDREGLGAAWPSGLRSPSESVTPLPDGFAEE